MFSRRFKGWLNLYSQLAPLFIPEVSEFRERKCLINIVFFYMNTGDDLTVCKLNTSSTTDCIQGVFLMTIW